jgi:hypothetical protein
MGALPPIRAPEGSMADTKFAPHPSIPRTQYLFLESGWLWKMNVKVDSVSKIFLKDAAGLKIQSRGIIIVPNSPEVFKGATSADADRTVEFLALSDGITMLDVTDGVKPEPIISLQVEVLPTPNKKTNLVEFTGESLALNSPDTPVPYTLKTTKRVSSGPPESLFDTVAKDTKNIAISAHGQMYPTSKEPSKKGIELFIAGTVTGSNVEAVFGKLKGKCPGGVVWIGGCEVGADLDFCKKAAKASNCYIVASGITLPPVKLAAGRIEFFPKQAIKFFDKDTGDLMKKVDFVSKQASLGFKVIAV